MTRLNELVSPLGIALSERQQAQFETYYQMLLEWNNVMNLTGITKYEDVLQKHFADSLSIVRVVDLQKVDTVIDVGTGAGFPGVPLKIAYPHLRIVLLDSLNKRLKFLDAVIDALGLTGIRTLHGRAEDYAHQKEYREQFDLCVSRAVANLATLSEYCVPFVKQGGEFVSYKSSAVDDEIKSADRAIRLLGGKIHRIDRFTLPGAGDKRAFVCVEKIRPTGKKFPRKAGTPAREPLS